jgi:dUTP pyrophosphatase
MHVLGGVIDSDYPGEWVLILANLSKYVATVEPDDRIAQVVFVPHWTGGDVDTKRSGGFGSTGR